MSSTYEVSEVHKYKGDDTKIQNDVALLKLKDHILLRQPDINYVKVPKTEEVAKILKNKRPLTMYGFYGDPTRAYIYGEVSKHTSKTGEISDITATLDCPDVGTFCILPLSQYHNSVINRKNDAGGAIVHIKNGIPYAVGISSFSLYYPRFDNSELNDWIHSKVVDVRYWSDNNRSGYENDLYIYYNPTTNHTEFFIKLRDGVHQYFPTDKTSNNDWLYLNSGNEYIARDLLNTYIKNKNTYTFNIAKDVNTASISSKTYNFNDTHRDGHTNIYYLPKLETKESLGIKQGVSKGKWHSYEKYATLSINIKNKSKDKIYTLKLRGIKYSPVKNKKYAMNIGIDKDKSNLRLEYHLEDNMHLPAGSYSTDDVPIQINAIGWHREFF